MFRCPALRCVVLVVLTACQQTATENAVPTFDAGEHVARWVELWRTYDLRALEDLFVAEPSVTYLSSEREGLLQGMAALREHHAGMGFVDGGTVAGQELWIEELHATSHGATSIVTAVWYFGDRGASRDSLQRGPMTAVYVWTEAGYRIAHMHFANY